MFLPLKLYFMIMSRSLGFFLLGLHFKTPSITSPWFIIKVSSK